MSLWESFDKVLQLFMHALTLSVGLQHAAPTHTQTHMHTYAGTHIQTHARTHTYGHVHRHTHTRTHAQTHTHMWTHAHTHTQAQAPATGLDCLHTFRVCFSLLQLNIWDTAGAERYLSVGAMYYRNADGVLFVFDVTKPKTFSDIQTKWLEMVAKQEA